MQDLEKKIHACWLGKAIGGTLGMPHEGKPGPLDLGFYDPVPDGCLPNDDLDLQLVWLHALRQRGDQPVGPALFADAWRRYVDFPWDEYGVCLRNIAYGIPAADLGVTDNWFGEGMGAAIRSEIWACLAPGDPDRAAGFAWMDAVCDHGGEGVWAEVFLAAIESAAFTEHDTDRLLDLSLAYLPADSRVRVAIEDTRAEWQRTADWREVLAMIYGRHRLPNFTDVAANLAITILGLLAGERDFGKSICIATNCGLDTDCTAATLGSLLGILAPDSIPERWKQPIGEDVALSPQIIGIEKPATLARLTEWTLELRDQLRDENPRIGPVHAVRPGDAANPVRIPVEIADGDLPDEGTFRADEFTGHWLRLAAADWTAEWKTFRFNTREGFDQTAIAMAFAQTPVRVWLGEAELHTGNISRHPDYQSGGPSFHRPGSHTFKLAEGFRAGDRLTIAIQRPSDASDLVFGLANAANEQWLPHALAYSASESTK